LLPDCDRGAGGADCGPVGAAELEPIRCGGPNRASCGSVSQMAGAEFAIQAKKSYFYATESSDRAGPEASGVGCGPDKRSDYEFVD